MQIETRHKILATTVAMLLPFAAATLARIVTNNSEAQANAFYITAFVDPFIFGGAAAIARRKALRS